MYPFLLVLHSFFRWFVLASLLFSIYIASQGLSQKLIFTKTANAIRHWTATIAHMQLIIGITIYFQSPIVKFTVLDNEHKLINEHAFFKYVHISMMILSVVPITIGSAKAKRMATDQEKYQTMLKWFSLGLLIIFIGIPWPFSPLAGRPYIRSF